MRINEKKITAIMNERGIRRSDLAVLLSVSRQRVEQLLHLGNISDKCVARVARILNISPSEFIDDDWWKKDSSGKNQ